MSSPNEGGECAGLDIALAAMAAKAAGRADANILDLSRERDQSPLPTKDGTRD